MREGAPGILPPFQLLLLSFVDSQLQSTISELMELKILVCGHCIQCRLGAAPPIHVVLYVWFYMHCISSEMAYFHILAALLG